MKKNIWKNSFKNQLKDHGIDGVWSFYIEDNLQPQLNYLQNTQRTFAGFQCSRCSREWNSAQVHILVLINLDRIYRRGTVKMRIFRQRCRRCNNSILENPKISKENIRRVISNVVSKILTMIYGYTTGPPLEPVVYSDHVDGPHEKKYCEACEMNMCPWHTEYHKKTKVNKLQSVKVHQGASSRPQEQYIKIFMPTNTSAHNPPATAVNINNIYKEMICLMILLVIFVVLFMSIA